MDKVFWKDHEQENNFEIDTIVYFYLFRSIYSLLFYHFNFNLMVDSYLIDKT